MIRYTLNCDKGHTFESWFANSAAYDEQAKRWLIACPVCNSTKVEKAIMAPRLGHSETADESPAPTPARTPVALPAPPSPVAMMSPVEHELRKKLKELREHIVKNADYVGPRFPEQARKIHYGEVEPLDLWRGDTERGRGTARGRHRLRSAAGPAGRV